MPWKFILFIFFLILGAVFTGLNLGNSCNINFGFKTFEQIPVFLTILFSFVAGILVTLPFALSHGKKESAIKPEKGLKNKKQLSPEVLAAVEDLPYAEAVERVKASKNNKRP